MSERRTICIPILIKQYPNGELAEYSLNNSIDDPSFQANAFYVYDRGDLDFYIIIDDNKVYQYYSSRGKYSGIPHNSIEVIMEYDGRRSTEIWCRLEYTPPVVHLAISAMAGDE